MVDNCKLEAQKPCYAVIFTGKRTAGDQGYGEMSQRMRELVARQPGFIGMESVRDESGFGITVSYWESLEAIRNWKQNEDHQLAQEKGKQTWYENYTVRICKIEQEYRMEKR